MNSRLQFQQLNFITLHSQNALFHMRTQTRKQARPAGQNIEHGERPRQLAPTFSRARPETYAASTRTARVWSDGARGSSKTVVSATCSRNGKHSEAVFHSPNNTSLARSDNCAARARPSLLTATPANGRTRFRMAESGINDRATASAILVGLLTIHI